MQLKKLQRHLKAKLGKPVSFFFFNSDASDLCENQMLSRTYILKEVQVPGLSCKGPADGDARWKCRQRHLSDALLDYDYLVLS